MCRYTECRLLTVFGKFICWDSFASQWFLGPKRLSETFEPTLPMLKKRSERELELWKLYPTARDYYQYRKEKEQ